VNWSATGGTIDAAGSYAAGSVAGTYRVIAATTTGTLADTSIVVVSAPAPAPAPTLVAVNLTPVSASLSAGATKQFSAYGTSSAGDSIPVAVAFTATGGTINSSGLYTAGTTAGTFRVIAVASSGALADTAAVVITAPAPTLSAVYVTPVSASLAAGGTQQFLAYGRNSAGDSIPVTVAFTASGGSVTASGLYTAGSTGGTFRVVAKESVSGLADSSAVTVTVPAPSTATGIPYGPFSLWDTYTTVKWGPTPFTASINYTDPAGIVSRISAARLSKQKLVLFMTDGAHTLYTTNGVFDMSKWKARMDQYNTTTIKNAVAAGVSDGTIIGNSIMDEPEHKSWGGVMTKPMLDQMASYVKAMFPTLPVGVNHGPGGYKWHSTERYHVVDYTVNQYNWWITKGDVVTWRNAVLTQTALDGVTPAFSLNILDGGVEDNDGVYDCTGPGQAGTGTFGTNCRMTASDMRTWGQALLPKGCMLLSWKFDDTFMSRSDDQQAFRDLGAQAASLPARGCGRS
jgi:hypothetical protein